METLSSNFCFLSFHFSRVLTRNKVPLFEDNKFYEHPINERSGDNFFCFNNFNNETCNTHAIVWTTLVSVVWGTVCLVVGVLPFSDETTVVTEQETEVLV